MDHVERLFWSVAIFVGIHFLWLSFIEPYLPVAFGTAVAAVAALWFFLRGWRYIAKIGAK